MFERIVSNVLVRLLGDYIEDIDRIWKGNIELNNLRLKRSALDMFDLPFCVVHGYVGNITAAIPWRSLGSSVVSAQISDIFIVVQPKKNVRYNQQLEKEKELSTKKKKLENYESVRQLKSTAKKASASMSTPTGESFLTRLTETIINNLQVNIRKVHVRYEDTTDPKTEPVVFGLTIDTLDLASTGANWQKAFIKELSGVFYKLVELKNLSIYMTKSDGFIFTDVTTHNDFVAKMKTFLETRAKRRYLLKPVNGTLKITAHSFNLTKTEPVFTGDLSLEQVSLALDADQYNGFLNTLDYMTNFQKYEMFRGLKPNAGFSTPQERTKWWNFAFNALKHEFDGSHFTWDQIEQRKLKREEYIPLFKKTLKAPWLKSPTNIELDRLKKLEEEIDFETIVVCREIARDEIHAEKRERDRKFALEMQQRQSPMKQSAPTTPPKQSTSSWFSRFTKKLERKTDDTTSDTGTFDDEMSDTGVHMTDQEQQDLIDLIGFDDDTLLNRSNDWVMFQLNVVLDGGAIELINNKSNSAIVKGVYKKLEAAIGIREAARGVLVDISLGDFFIEDMYSEATMFKKIMMRHVEHDGPLVAVKIEVNPVDGRSDLFVDVKLERTDLVFNAPLVQKIMSFFVVPSSVNLKSLESAAKRQMQLSLKQAVSRLSLELEAKKTYDINVLVLAPTILVPADFTKSSSELLVVDLGKLVFKSDNDGDRSKRARSQNFEEKDFYDRFDLEVNEIQVVQTTLMDRWKEKIDNQQIDDPELLERIDIGLKIAKRITPDALNANVKIDGSISHVKLNFSPEKFHRITGIINNIIDLADNPTGKARDIKMEGTLKFVSGPEFVQNKEFRAELLDNGELFLYKSSSAKAIAKLDCVSGNNVVMFDNHGQYGLSKKYKRTDSWKLSETQFACILYGTNDTDFIIDAGTEEKRKEWCSALHECYLDHSMHHANIHEGKITSFEESASLEDDRKRKKVSLQFAVPEFTINVFQDKAHKLIPLTSLTIQNLNAAVDVRRFDTYVDIHLQKFLIDDLLNNQTVMTSRGSEELANFCLTAVTDRRSALYDKGSDLFMSLKCGELDALFEANFVGACTKFGIDLSDTIKELSERTKTYQSQSKVKEETTVAPTFEHIRQQRNEVHLTADLNSLVLSLGDKGQRFISFKMADAAVVFAMNQKGMYVDGTVGDLLAIPQQVENSKYHEILGLSNTQSHSLIEFSFCQSMEIKPQHAEDAVYDKQFIAKMESIHMIYIADIVNKVIVYFLTGSIMSAINEANSKFAGPTTKAQQSLCRLDITLTKPIIMLPKSHVSNDKMVADLGTIKLTNHLEDNFETITVAMEAMTLSTDIKEKSTPVIHNMNIDLFVKRNLFLKQVPDPDVTVSMDIPDMSLNMSHLQYQLIWETIENNIMAGGGFVPQQVVLPTSEIQLEEQIATKVLINLPKFNLTVLREEQNPLAQMNMYGLSIQVDKLSNGKTKVDVNLKEIDAYDLRKESESQFKNFINTRVKQQNAPTEDFISVNVLTDIQANETTVKIIMGDPRIIFEPGVVMELVSFGMKRFSGDHVSLLRPTIQELKNQQIQATKVQVQVGRPSLVVPVNARLADSRLLVLQFGAQFAMEQRPATGYESFNVGVIDMVAFMEYRDVARVDKVAPILEPLAVALQIETMPHEHDAVKIDKKITASVLAPVRIRVAYQDIKNILDVVQEFIEKNKLAFTTPSTRRTRSSSSVVNFDTTGQFNLDTYYDDEETPKVVSPLDVKIPNLSKAVETEIALVVEKLPKISVLLVNDLSGHDIPLVKLSVTNTHLLLGSINQNGEHVGIRINAIAFIGMGYYNMKRADWEPIIEGKGLQVKYARKPNLNPKATVPFLDKIHIHDIHDDILKKFRLPLSATLNINMTQDMLATVIATTEQWKDDYSGKIVPEKFDPYILRNHSGLPAEISFGADQDEETSIFLRNSTEKITKKMVPPATEFGFSQPQNQISKEFFISVKIMGEVLTINGRKIGRSRLEVKDRVCIVEVELDHGRRVITIRSGIKIVNRCPIAWNIGYVLEGDNVTKIDTVLPNSSLGIPINVVSKGTLVVQPVTDDTTSYHWSRADAHFHFTSLMNRSNCIATCFNANEKEAVKAFYAVMKSTFEDRVDRIARDRLAKEAPHLLQRYSCAIELRPPLAIQNLFATDMDYALYDKRVTTTAVAHMLLTKGTLTPGQVLPIHSTNLKNNIFLSLRPSKGEWSESMAMIFSSDGRSENIDSVVSIRDRLGKELRIHLDYEDGDIAYRNITCYCMFWVINRTKLPISVADSYNTEAAGQQYDLQPLPLSVSENVRKIKIRVKNGTWSNLFPLDNVGVSGNVTCIDGETKYAIGISNSLGPGKYKRTRVITLVPRYTIVNQTEREIAFHQLASRSLTTLKPSEKLNFHFKEKNLSTPSLQISIPHSNLTESPPFSMEVLGTVPIKLIDVEKSKSGIPLWRLLTVNVKEEEQGALTILIQEPSKPPYLIDNHLTEDIILSQNKEKWWTIEKNSKLAWGWDTTDKQILYMKFANFQGMNPLVVDLNKISAKDTVYKIDKKRIFIRVVAKGPTRVMKITSKQLVDLSTPPRKPSIGNSGFVNVTKASPLKGNTIVVEELDDDEEEGNEELKLFLEVTLAEIGVSLIESITPSEVVYVFLERLYIKYYQTDQSEMAEAFLGRVQIDNMERRAVFPVLFCNRHQLGDKPFLHLSMTRQIPTTDHMTIIPYFSVNMQEAAIRVEYVFIEKLVDIILGTIKSVKKEDNDLEHIYQGPEIKPMSSEYVYFNKLELHPIKLDFTFRYNRGAKVSAALLALRAIGFAANIDDAPIKMNALILERPFLTWDELINRIKIHYIRSSTSEVYKVLGSLEVIGNPVGLFNDLTTGVADFFYEPAIAITKGPEEFGYGLAKGSKSLVSKTFHGTFNTVSKVSGTLQRGLDYLTFDADHIKQKERKQAPQGLGEGLLRGGEATLTGIFDGVTGIVTQPIKGAKKEGGLGFVKGIGKGLIGLPMKPVGGLFEGVTSVTAGISTTSSMGGQPTKRMRYPRRFGDDGALIPFDNEQSLAFDILITADNGKYANTEGENEPIASLVSLDKTYVYILTGRALFKVSVSNRVLQWRYDLTQMTRLAREPKTGNIICEFATSTMFSYNAIVGKELRADKQSCDRFVKKLQECTTKAKQ